MFFCFGFSATCKQKSSFPFFRGQLGAFLFVFGFAIFTAGSKQPNSEKSTQLF